MQPGEMSARVQFLEPSEVDDGYRRRQEFTEVGELIWAKKTDVNDGEKWRAGQVSASVMSRFVVRYSAFTAVLTPLHRLSCQGRDYEIIGIKDGRGRRRVLEITAVAKV